MNLQNIHDIQRSIRVLAIFSEILQTFNANVEALISSVDVHIYNEVIAKSPNVQCLRFKDWFSDLSSYQIGDSIAGIVTYVLDNERKLCFIKDLNK